MADTPTSRLPRLRTYARDLESERARRGMPSVPTPKKTGAGTSTPPTPPPTAAQAEPTPATVVPPRTEAAPPEHIVAATPRPEHVSEAVRKTREDELEKERENRPTTIPPFHTLKAATRSTPRATAATAVSETEVITIDNDESGATIITDTKRDRFSLRKSFFASLRDWWQARARARKARKIPKYVVPETDRRKGVIQRATSHTGRQITSDHAQLRNLVRERETNPPLPVTEPETIWTPNTETIFELLPAPEPATHFSNVSTTARYSTTPAERERVPVAPTTPPPSSTPPPPIAETVPPVAVPAEEPAPAPAPTEQQEPEPELEATEEPTPPHRLPQPRGSRRFDTNTLSLGIVSIVVIIGLAGIGVRALLTPAPDSAVTESPLPLTMPLRTVEVTGDTRDTVINTLTSTQADATLPLQLLALQRGNTTIAPRTLLSLLDEQLGNTLAGEVTALYIGWHERTTAFVVLSVTDRTRVWGNLLQNEQALGTTFSPLLRTTGDSSFTDIRVGTYDLRRYQNGAGTEELVYGFINDTTLIITRDQATFLLVSALATTAP